MSSVFLEGISTSRAAPLATDTKKKGFNPGAIHRQDNAWPTHHGAICQQEIATLLR